MCPSIYKLWIKAPCYLSLSQHSHIHYTHTQVARCAFCLANFCNLFCAAAVVIVCFSSSSSSIDAITNRCNVPRQFLCVQLHLQWCMWDGKITKRKKIFVLAKGKWSKREWEWHWNQFDWRTEWTVIERNASVCWGWCRKKVAENSLFSNTSRSCMCFDSLGYSLWSLFILQIQLVNTAGGISVKWNIKFIRKENFKSHSRSDSYPALSIRWKFPDYTMRERENETKQSRNVSTLEIASVQQRQQAKSCD